MVRIENSLLIKTIRAFSHAKDELNLGDKLLKEVEKFDILFGGFFRAQDVTAFKNAKRTESQIHYANAIKTIRWVLDLHNITQIPAAYTDAEIDVIKEDIRTEEQ